jgi:predicted DNA-binding transcriptional regulator YafY
MAGYVPAHDHGRDGPRAMRADRFSTVRLGGPGIPPPRADSLVWAAGPLASAGCDFEIRRPKELRTSVRVLAARLRAA